MVVHAVVIVESVDEVEVETCVVDVVDSVVG